MIARFALAAMSFVAVARPAQAVDFPGASPGPAAASLEGAQLVMENSLLQVRWDLSLGSRRLVEVVDRITGSRLTCDRSLFRIAWKDGSETVAAGLCPDGEVLLERIEPDPAAIRSAERSAGWRTVLKLATADGKRRFRWQATLRDGSNYVRQETAVLLQDGSSAKELTVLDLPAASHRHAVRSTVHRWYRAASSWPASTRWPERVDGWAGGVSPAHLRFPVGGNAVGIRCAWGGSGRPTASRVPALPGARTGTTVSPIHVLHLLVRYRGSRFEDE